MYYKITFLKKQTTAFLIACLCSCSFFAQDDLLDELNEGSEAQTQFELPAFKAMKIGNLQSTKIVDKGDLYMYVSHRFGALSDGFDTFFGLDVASTKIQLLYSFWDGVQFSISRESFGRTLAAAAKARLAKQSNKFPLNLVAYTTINRNTEYVSDVDILDDADRYSYSAQLLMSRRFSKNFSFEIAPTYIRENFQNLDNKIEANHNQFAVGFGGRCKLSKRMSVNAEYIYNPSIHSNSVYENGYAFGVDIETGGHVFQLLFTNSQSSNEPGFISNADGDLVFGFNIVRVF